MNPERIAQPSRTLIQQLIEQSKAYPTMGDYEFQFDSEQTFALSMQRNSDMIGGIIGIVSRDWAFIETLWVDDQLRDEGIGKQLMFALESYAHQLGLNGIFLYTTDFQAPYFYPRVGYDTLGKLPNRPEGYNATYFAKTDFRTDGLTADIDIENPVTETTFDILESGLDRHAEGIAPIVAHERVFLMNDADDQICGGVFGHEFWGWLDVHLCYAITADDINPLLDQLESYCHAAKLGIITHTYDQIQADLLQARNYQIFAILPNRPTDTTCTIWIRPPQS